MGRLFLIGGEKGGVGKSFTARLLAQYMVDHHHPLMGFDTDKSHATFSRFYAEFTSAVKVDDFESLDEIIETAERYPDGNIIVDLAAQTAEQLKRWIDDSDLQGLMAELGYTVYLWHVMDDSADSMHLLDSTLNEFADSAIDLVVVQNYGRGQSFKRLENSAVYRRAKEAGVPMVLMARMHESLAQKIDYNDFSFWAAANNREVMKIAERQRVKVWLKHGYKQIARLLNDPVADADGEQNPLQATGEFHHADA